LTTQDNGDAVRHAEVGVTTRKLVVVAAGGAGRHPPPRHDVAVISYGLGEPDQVLQHRADGLAVRVAAQQVGADAGQAADEFELMSLWELVAVDAGVRGVDPGPGCLG
jgi:hypothetical protein